MEAIAVYIVANRKHGTIYIGSTSHLVQRAYQHREGMIEGFTKTHGCTRLVWFEIHDEIRSAREREGQIKKWKRAWKVALIEKTNPDWKNLWFDIRN